MSHVHICHQFYAVESWDCGIEWDGMGSVNILPNVSPLCWHWRSLSVLVICVWLIYTLKCLCCQMVVTWQRSFGCLLRESHRHFQTRRALQQPPNEFHIQQLLMNRRLLSKACFLLSVPVACWHFISSGVCYRNVLWRSITVKRKAQVNVLPTHSSWCLWIVFLHW